MPVHVGPPMGHPQGPPPMPPQGHHMQGYGGPPPTHQYPAPPPPNMQYNKNGGGPPAPMQQPMGGGGYPQQMSDDVEMAQKRKDFETLCQIINAWNANRLDLFALSLPNEHLEFHGVMRFYYQSSDMGSGQKVATKCIRVASTATTREIIETLIEKFRPDMKMLEVPEYALYEIHESGERKLGSEEKPLLVQLNWHKDDREGRFLLRRMDEPTMSISNTGKAEDPTFKRKLSKREKKELKKAEKAAKAAEKANGDKDKDEGVAEKLYTELPDTSFTRSISNPEAVMRRRRQQKLEKKLQQFRSRDGGPDTGGTLKIYGESICKDVPYKTLLLSVSDPAVYVVEEMLEKYGLDRKEAQAFCLVQVTSPPGLDNGGGPHEVPMESLREMYLEDEECPLAILMNHPPSRGTITFHVRRKPADFYPRKRKKKPLSHFTSDTAMMNEIPMLVELNVDGSDIHSRLPQRFILSQNVIEVGSDPSLAPHVGGGHALFLPPNHFIHPRHCVIANTEPGVVTVTPNHPEAETYVNGQRIVETTILSHGCTVRFGRNHVFRYLDPATDLRTASSVTLPVMSSGGPPQEFYGNYAPINRPNGGQNGYPAPPRGGPGHNMGQDNILPAVLEFREETEDAFFSAITMNLDSNVVSFKLAPTYTIYMATRFRASTHYRTELIPEERAVRLTEMLNNVAECIFATVETGQRDPSNLAFWMANASELLHFLKSDRHIHAFSLQAQDILAETVHNAFKFLVGALTEELEMCMPMVLSETEEDENTTQGIMKILSSAMGLLRKCRVNAALTIQLFSQLFHFINRWTFNQIVTAENKNYCTHRWGLKIKKRMGKVEQWAEKQGLELAADCHLARVVQAAHLLMARKNTAEDIASLSSICFKLNSLQLRTLLNKYEPSPDEKPISREMIDTIVRVAENTVDEVTNAEGREVTLEEDYVLMLPFLLPEDGYSCDIVKGVPSGLTEFIAPLQRAGLCVMTPQPTSLGFWTIYMESFGSGGANNTAGSPNPSEISYNPEQQPHPAQMQHLQQMQHQRHLNGPPVPPQGGQQQQPEPEIQAIRLKKANGGMGLSIVAAKGIGKDKLGIYVKAVVDNGAAYHDGRLEPGDQLLKVDGTSLVGITQERAAEIMMHTGQVVELEVAKQGAIYHGLSALLAQPSPVLSPRGGPQHSQPPPPSSLLRPGSTQPPIPPFDQHLYQNHQPSMMNPAAASPMGRPPSAGMRSASIQNLSHQPLPAPPHPVGNGPAAMMGQRQASQPALLNGGPQPRVVTNGEDQGYYQNIGTAHLQQPMPLRYNNGGPGPVVGQQRFGSQSSLQQQPRNNNDGMVHASPRIIGTPQVSASGGQRSISQIAMTSPAGPEKPQRLFEDNKQRSISQGNPPRGVRFQDPKEEEENNKVNDVNSHLEQLRLSSVEREFRKRIAEYKRNEGESGSDGDGELVKNLVNGKLDNLRKLEAKKSELEKAEEKILQSAATRKKSGNTPPMGNESPVPPPVPTVPPPDFTPSGAQRLDALIGGSTSTPVAATKTNGISSKKVSFAAAEDFDTDANKENKDEREALLEKYEKDPNKFISEAENLLNSSSLEKYDFNKSTGHTPSVIGAQEVYRDPRMRRMQQKQEEEKSTKTSSRDGAKLSFQEKMELFRKESGDANANRDKAKISKAQREIGDDNNAGGIMRNEDQENTEENE